MLNLIQKSCQNRLVNKIKIIITSKCKYQVRYNLKGGLGGTQTIIVEANNSTEAYQKAKGMIPSDATIAGTPTLASGRS